MNRLEKKAALAVAAATAGVIVSGISLIRKHTKYLAEKAAATFDKDEEDEELTKEALAAGTAEEASEPSPEAAADEAAADEAAADEAAADEAAVDEAAGDGSAAEEAEAEEAAAEEAADEAPAEAAADGTAAEENVPEEDND